MGAARCSGDAAWLSGAGCCLWHGAEPPSSARLLSTPPAWLHVAHRPTSLMPSPLISRRPLRGASHSMQVPQVSQEGLASLQEMGFSEQLCRNALLLHRNHLERALEWLIENAADPAAAEPLRQAVACAQVCVHVFVWYLCVRSRAATRPAQWPAGAAPSTGLVLGARACEGGARQLAPCLPCFSHAHHLPDSLLCGSDNTPRRSDTCCAAAPAGAVTRGWPRSTAGAPGGRVLLWTRPAWCSWWTWGLTWDR